MNRERKHRAWHTASKQMLYAKSSDIFKWLDEGQPIEVMDYCGLHDKNGKEIYEGDIVQKWETNYDKDDMPLEPVEISFIEYRKCGFWVAAESFGYEGEDMWDWDRIEVIGNIFQNPELLNN